MPKLLAYALAVAMLCGTAVATENPGESQALPRAAAALSAEARRVAQSAKTPADFLKAADLFRQAAQLAPWMAEYHFRRGEQLQKAGQNAAAADAFARYLQTAPDAKDTREVTALIAALRRSPASPAPPAETQALHAGDVLHPCPECPEMLIIPAGRFTMGSPREEIGRFDSEGPQRTVTVPAFALSTTLVMQKEFAKFLAETAYQPEPCDRIMFKSWRSPGKGLVYPPGQADLPEQPAVCINLHDVERFIAWLNGKLARTQTGAVAGGAFRLPSEAEWEYAARGGTTSSRWWGDAPGVGNANCNGCGSAWDNTLIAPARAFGPNPFGLYDVLGNVWQWTADCWNENYTGAPVDAAPWAAGDCTKRVIRGGSWSNLPVFVRSATRARADIGGSDFDYSSYVGFRVAMTLKPETAR
jgi:formylglycine-generating enzyme required for sulfatase activity